MAERLAVVDLGSNAVRLVLARIRLGVEFRMLREERVQTRLGGGATGRLPARAMRDTVAAVRDFLEAVRGRQSPRVIAVATAAVREAPNAQRLIDGLRRDTGIVPEVLSGEEEARLGAIAVLRSLSIEDGMVFDLGGGGLQLTQLQDGRLKRALDSLDPAHAGIHDHLVTPLRLCRLTKMDARGSRCRPEWAFCGKVRTEARTDCTRGDEREHVRGEAGPARA